MTVSWRAVLRRHLRRLLIQLAILVLMFAVNAASEELFVLLVAVVLVALPVATWTVFGLLLWTSSKAPDIESLAERVDDALSAALSSTVAAIIGGAIILRVAGIITTPIGSLLTVGLAFVVVTVSVPALSFLSTWRDVYLPMVRRKVSERGEG